MPSSYLGCASIGMRGIKKAGCFATNQSPDALIFQPIHQNYPAAWRVQQVLKAPSVVTCHERREPLNPAEYFLV